MKRSLLLMTLVYGSVYAEPESLPPVIDNSSYYGGESYSKQPPAPQAASTNTASAIYEVLGQLEQLQKEVRQLSGTVEEQAHELAELKKRQSSLYEDMDQRLQGLENAKNATETATPSSAAIEATSPVSVATPAAENKTSAPVPVPVVVPAPVVSTPAPVAPVVPKQLPPPQTADPTPKLATPVAKSATEKATYQKAYENLKTGQYSKAITAFNAFLGDYPESDFAANAQYWIGEAYKASQNTEASREAFNKVINNYPNSPKVPDALLKLGYLELEQNNIVKAREYLNHVSTGFPNTPAAQLAAKKLGALNGVQ